MLPLLFFMRVDCSRGKNGVVKKTWSLVDRQDVLVPAAVAVAVRPAAKGCYAKTLPSKLQLTVAAVSCPPSRQLQLLTH